MKDRILLCLVSLFCAAAPAIAQSSRSDPQVASLRGIEGVAVKVTLGSIGANQDDPTEQEMQTYFEQRLRAAGLSVAASSPSHGGPIPTLEVFISFRNEDRHNYYLSMHAGLRQAVALKRDPSVEVSAVTWDWHVFFWGGGATNTKRREIGRAADAFICSYSDANPRSERAAASCRRERTL